MKKLWRAMGGGLLAGGVVGFTDYQHQAGQVAWDIISFVWPGLAAVARQESWEYFLGAVAVVIISGAISGAKSVAGKEV